MKKEIVIFVIAYITATAIRGLTLHYTGFSFNVIQDKFDLISFVLDLMMWTLSYIGVRFLITNLIRKVHWE